MDDAGNHSHNYKKIGNQLSKTELFIGYPQAIKHQFSNIIVSSISTVVVRIIYFKHECL